MSDQTLPEPVAPTAAPTLGAGALLLLALVVLVLFLIHRGQMHGHDTKDWLQLQSISRQFKGALALIAGLIGVALILVLLQLAWPRIERVVELVIRFVLGSAVFVLVAMVGIWVFRITMRRLGEKP